MQTLWASLFVFGLLIIFHELGHFIVAKSAGIKVHEFSIGFGPKILSFAGRETAYNLRIFPLGGFVRMEGMDPEENVEDEARSFNKKPVFQRMSVIVAGSLMNFVLAVLLLTLVFMLQGLPVPTIEKLVQGQPAQAVGLAPGDKIIAINGQKMNQATKMTEVINSHVNKELVLTIKRNGQTKDIKVVPESDENGKGIIGVYLTQSLERQGFFVSLSEGARATVEVTWLIIHFLGQIIIGKAPADFGGPVRIVSEIGKVAQLGIFNLLQMAAFLSINLGLFNLFPIPALDGSRLMFLGVELLRGKPVDPTKESFIHMVGFGLLILFIMVITYNDILLLYQK
jgi:regulator of sigma E protease